MAASGLAYACALLLSAAYWPGTRPRDDYAAEMIRTRAAALEHILAEYHAVRWRRTRRIDRHAN